MHPTPSRGAGNSEVAPAATGEVAAGARDAPPRVVQSQAGDSTLRSSWARQGGLTMAANTKGLMPGFSIHCVSPAGMNTRSPAHTGRSSPPMCITPLPERR